MTGQQFSRSLVDGTNHLALSLLKLKNQVIVTQKLGFMKLKEGFDSYFPKISL